MAARPLVRQLKPASVNLAKATPSLSNVFAVLNHFVNMVGYNPGGAQHGYLWWLAWLNHSARTLFAVQDANGVFRPAVPPGQLRDPGADRQLGRRAPRRSST